MNLSIVTTLYCSDLTLPSFYERIRKAAETTTRDYEIIFVNDDSPDKSLEIALTFQQQDERVVVVDLSRNFGHHRALMTGLSYAQGEEIFLIDSDLEEQPEWLPLFQQLMQEHTCDVVYGQQSHRKGNFMERVSGFIFYKVFNLLSRTPIPESATSARLMSRRYVKALLSYPERELFIPGLWQLAGFRQVAYAVVKGDKKYTTYSFARKIALSVNAITSFSDRPLVYIFYTGTFICLGAGGYIVRLLLLKCFRGIPLLGWPSLVVSIWFLGGLTIFFIGVLGIYLSKVFVEIKQRPLSIVRNIYSSSSRHNEPTE